MPEVPQDPNEQSVTPADPQVPPNTEAPQPAPAAQDNFPTSSADSEPSTLASPGSSEPAMQSDSQPNQFSSPLPMKQQSRKKTILMLAGVLVLLVMIGGGIAFAVWNSSPQKVLNDSLGNLLQTPPKAVSATGSISADDGDLTFSVLSGMDTSNNRDMSITADYSAQSAAATVNLDAILAKKGDVYLKLNDAKKLLDQLSAGSPQAATTFDGLLQKVDGKWVKITSDDIKKLSGNNNSDESQCVSDAFSTFQNDTKQKNEVKDVYVKNQFLTVKSQKADEAVSGRNSYHYVLDADEAKARSFAQGLKQTTIYQNVNKCLGNTLNDSMSPIATADNDVVSTLDVWIDKSTRNFTRVNLDQSSAKEKTAAKVDTVLGYNTKSITLPTTTTSFQDVQTELQKLFGGVSPSDLLPKQNS